jgi:hypothetical protein
MSVGAIQVTSTLVGESGVTCTPVGGPGTAPAGVEDVGSGVGVLVAGPVGVPLGVASGPLGGSTPLLGSAGSGVVPLAMTAL